MKTILLGLLMALSVQVFAQSGKRKFVEIPGKPTMEETVEFINNHLQHIAKDLTQDIHNCDGKYYSDRYFKIEIDTLKPEVKIISKYVHEINGIKEAREYEINLSDTEYLKVIPDFSGHCWQKGIYFKEKNKVTQEDLQVPLRGWSEYHYYFPSDVNMWQSKIFKAFEHLRKLSGAPEPLQF